MNKPERITLNTDKTEVCFRNQEWYGGVKFFISNSERDTWSMEMFEDLDAFRCNVAITPNDIEYFKKETLKAQEKMVHLLKAFDLQEIEIDLDERTVSIWYPKYRRVTATYSLALTGPNKGSLTVSDIATYRIRRKSVNIEDIVENILKPIIYAATGLQEEFETSEEYAL